MLVYGKVRARESLCEAGRAVASLWEQVFAQGALLDSDALRTALIATGQLEQAALDGRIASGHTTALGQLLSAAADLFWSHWSLQRHPGAGRRSKRAVLAELRERCAALAALPEAQVSLSNPEGFAFYALYPEQYAEAAWLWLGEPAHAQPAEALVLGIRSIGTTLGAVVAAVLRAHGWRVRALSVRPTGPAFAREIRLPPGSCAGVDFALVADEGPGLSGSSFAAAVHAIRQEGLEPQRIAIFPGHDHGPGPQASAVTLACWASTRCYHVGLDAAFVHGPWPAELADRLAQRLGSAFEVSAWQDASAGRWRELVFADHARWPAVCARFERSKYLLTTRRAGRQLLKFAGLGREPGSGLSLAQAQAARLRSRTGQAEQQLPRAVIDGFLVLPFFEGRPLQAADASGALLDRAARHIVSAAHLPPRRLAIEQGVDRLWNMLEHNLREAFGEGCGESVVRARAAQWPHASLVTRLAYGDGHLAPYEWLRDTRGRIVKVDAWGHDADHTLVGTQSLLWDVAGLFVEWRLDARARAAFQRAYLQHGGEPAAPATLAFYELAYATFRLGLYTLCAATQTDPRQRADLQRAAARYRSQVARMLRIQLNPQRQASRYRKTNPTA
jgi:hypothetical protein